MRQMTITEARLNLLSLPEVVEDEPMAIAKRGRPVMVAMGYDQYESLVETLDILSDQAFSQRLSKSLQQVKAGKTKTSADVRKRLGL
jgi:prevent-host-death family protein